MKLLIHEPNNKGHFLHSARLIAEAAIACGATTEISVRRDAPSTPEFKLHMGPILSKLAAVNAFDLPAGGTLTAVSAASGRACVEIAARRGAEHILVPAADGVAPMLAARSWGGLRRILPKGAELEAGLIRPYDATDELAACVDRMASDEALRLEMGRNARRQAEANDIDAYSRAIADLMRRLAGGAPAA